MKKISGICFFVLMTGCILTHSSLSLAYAALGLTLWYEKMVPVLLPFMILSGTLIRMGMTDSLIRPVRPLFGRIYRLSAPGIYVILMGFLCAHCLGISGQTRNFFGGRTISAGLLQQSGTSLFPGICTAAAT